MTTTRWYLYPLAFLALALLSGCIADTAEDTELPWASNRSWEGMAPIAPGLLDRYGE